MRNTGVKLANNEDLQIREKMETTMKGKTELGKKLEIFLKFDVEHLFLILSSLREFLFFDW